MTTAPSLTKFTRYPKILIYGLPGLGKSTLASEMPNPVFIATTDGLEGLSVRAFPVAKTAQDVRNAISYLMKEDHQFKTVVLDTLGWLEKLVHEEVCGQLGLEFMTQSSMKSYPLAGKKLKEILSSFDELNSKRKMMVCLIGHAEIQKFEDPSTASYDRYSLQMNEKVAALFMQDVDIVAFMNQKVVVREEKEGFSKVNKAAGSARHLFFDLRPAFYAKQHGYGLPDEMQIEEGKGWAAMWECMKPKFITGKSVSSNGKTSVSKSENEGSIPSADARNDLALAAEAQTKRRLVEKSQKEVAAKAASDADDVPANFIS